MIKAVPSSGRDRVDVREASRRSEVRHVATSDTPARLHGAQLNRVESTLNSLLAAVTAAADSSEPDWQAQPREGRFSPHQSLGSTIAEITRRQRDLDYQTRTPRPDASPQMGPPPGAFGDVSSRMTSRPGATSLSSLQGDIAALAANLDDMHREQAARYAESPPVCNLDKLRMEIADMSDALRNLASRGSVAALESTIRVLAQRIDASRSEGTRENVLQPLERLVDEMRLSLAAIDPRTTIKGLESELKKLGTKLDDLGRAGLDPSAFRNIQQQTQEIRDLLSAASTRPMPLERIEQQVAELAESIDRRRDVAVAGGVGSRNDDSVRASTLGKIDGRLDAIAAKVEEAIAEARDQSRYEALSGRIDDVHQELTARVTGLWPATDTRPLEDLVRGLVDKIENARAPQADNQAIEALERQIAELAQRFDRSNAGFSSLTVLEHSISDLFSELEKTRRLSLDAAENAARNMLKEASAQGPAYGASSYQRDFGQELFEFRSLQEEADQQTRSTLNAVHETLEKVVDRLAMVEAELAERRLEPATQLLASGPAPAFTPAPQRGHVASKNPLSEDLTARRGTPPGKVKNGMPGAAAFEEFLIEPGAGFPSRRDGANDEAGGQPAPTRPQEPPEVPAIRSDFIAAARRAAQAAQMESAAAMMPQARAAASTEAEGSDGLIAQTRNFIAQHKRPVVLSLAALFVAVGAYAVVKTMGHTQPTSLSYNVDRPAPAQIVPPAPPPPISAPPALPSLSPISAPPRINSSALDPSPTQESQPTQVTPAIDPMTVATIPPKPKDAAIEPAPGTSQSGLQNAAEAGNAKAQYLLAVDYAEGRHLSRDLKAPAQWYDKAAAQDLAPAQYRPASFYEKGLGVTRDLGQAKIWYQKAAERGNIRAMHNRAVLFADGGDSGKPDYASAAQWFKKAAEYGVRDSQYNLAVLLARGLGISQNFVSSYTWFVIAAAQGDDDAAKKRDDVSIKLNDNELAAAKAMATAFHAKTSDQAANEVRPPQGGFGVPAASGKAQRPKVSEL
jgi:localization factor PodJL